MTYEPAEDSFFLEKEIIKYLERLNEKEISKFKVLDMGSGSGIQAKACIDKGILKKNLFLIDLDSEAIKLLKNQKIFEDKNIILSDLFSEIPKTPEYLFDIIIFNAPYLPKDDQDYDTGIDTTGGKQGYEITLRFLKQAKDYLKNKGILFLLISSHTNKSKITDFLLRNDYKIIEINEESSFFEKLYVLKISKILTNNI